MLEIVLWLFSCTSIASAPNFTNISILCISLIHSSQLSCLGTMAEDAMATIARLKVKNFSILKNCVQKNYEIARNYTCKYFLWVYRRITLWNRDKSIYLYFQVIFVQFSVHVNIISTFEQKITKWKSDIICISIVIRVVWKFLLCKSYNEFVYIAINMCSNKQFFC